ncbi:MAG: SPOR domain-containing protein, partial [Gemmatimonadaceae bacterium]
MRRIALFTAALSVFALRDATAQPAAPVSAGVTSAVARARALSNDGDDAKSRTLLDSLVNTAPRESNDLAEILYWRASLSSDAQSSERDWKRLVVDVPFSPRAGEALVKLSEQDLQRNNPAIARQHVQQLLLDHPDSPQRSRGLLVLARSYFDQRDTPRGCGIVSAVRRDAPLSAVEVRLQADELQQQCRNVVEVAMGKDPDFAAPVPVAAAGSLATQTAALPAGRGAAPVNNKTDTARQAPTKLSPAAAKALADSVRRDSVARATALRVAQKEAADSLRRDSLARVTATRTAAKQTADSVRRDSVMRVVAQRQADSVRRDSVTRAGLQRAAALRIADNARRDSILHRDSVARASLRRDSIALDSMGRNRAPANTGRGATNPPVVTTRGGSQTREVLLINADSARGDSLAREAAAVEARILGNVATRDSIKRDTEAKAAAKRAAVKAAKWTVQIAAYQSKADADALVKRLLARNLDAHIAGTRKPYRVQVGRFATRAEAVAEVASLKKSG